MPVLGRPSRAIDFICRRPSFFVQNIRNRHFGRLFGQKQAGGATDSQRAARDDGYFVFDPLHCFPLFANDRTSKTVWAAPRKTFSATLPKTHRFRPVRPWVLSTIRSTDFEQA